MVLGDLGLDALGVEAEQPRVLQQLDPELAGPVQRPVHRPVGVRELGALEVARERDVAPAEEGQHVEPHRDLRTDLGELGQRVVEPDLRRELGALLRLGPDLPGGVLVQLLLDRQAREAVEGAAELGARDEEVDLARHDAADVDPQTTLERTEQEGREGEVADEQHEHQRGREVLDDSLACHRSGGPTGRGAPRTD